MTVTDLNSTTTGAKIVFGIPLGPGDRVISAFPSRDTVLIVTEHGKVFEVRVQMNEDGTHLRLVQVDNTQPQERK